MQIFNKQFQLREVWLIVTRGGGSLMGSLRVIKIVDPESILPTAISPKLLQAVVINKFDRERR